MIKIAECYLNPRLIIFDKDGTLIDFRSLWHPWFKKLITTLNEQVALNEPLRSAISETLGYYPDEDRWDPLGPLTLAPIGDICLLLPGTLYRYTELDWNQVTELVNRVEKAVRESLPLVELVRPVGDARGLLTRLHQDGISLALATSDIRDITLASLRVAQIDDLFDIILCADDDIAVKPSPDAVLRICSQLGIPPDQTIVIGDSIDDMHMARVAGAMASIGVTSGANPASLLQPLADILIHDIHEIHII